MRPLAAAALISAFALTGCRPALRPEASPSPKSPPLVPAASGVRLTRPEPALARIDALKHNLQWSAFPAAGGRRVPVYLAYPAAPGPAPAIVVAPDSRGVTPAARAMAERLAESGYLALVPKLPSEDLSDGGDTFISGPIATADVLEKAFRFAKTLRACNGSVGLVGLGKGARDACALEPFPQAAALVYYGESADAASGEPDCGVGASRVDLGPGASGDFLLAAEDIPSGPSGQGQPDKGWAFVEETLRAKLAR